MNPPLELVIDDAPAPQDQYFLGDIVRLLNFPIAYRVLTVGAIESPDCLHIFVGNSMRTVMPCNVEKLVDIRYDHVSCCLNEWGRFDQDTKVNRVIGSIMARRDMSWREDFQARIIDNIGLFDAVVVQVYSLMERGLNRWSMRTIFEYLRHTTAIADNTSKFKINNDLAPDSARLCTVLFPEIGNMFELRAPASRQVA